MWLNYMPDLTVPILSLMSKLDQLQVEYFKYRQIYMQLWHLEDISIIFSATTVVISMTTYIDFIIYIQVVV